MSKEEVRPIGNSEGAEQAHGQLTKEREHSREDLSLHMVYPSLISITIYIPLSMAPKPNPKPKGEKNHWYSGLTSGFLLRDCSGTQGPDEVLRIEPGLATCKGKHYSLYSLSNPFLSPHNFFCSAVRCNLASVPETILTVSESSRSSKLHQGQWNE